MSIIYFSQSREMKYSDRLWRWSFWIQINFPPSCSNPTDGVREKNPGVPRKAGTGLPLAINDCRQAAALHLLNTNSLTPQPSHPPPPWPSPTPSPTPPSYTKACTIIITRILCSSPRSHLIKLCNKVLTYDHSQNHRARICHIWFRTTIHMTYILKACWTIRDFRNQETSIWLHFEISRSLISSRF